MIISAFYEAIMARLSTLPEIKHFDYYMGQYDSEEEKELPFMCPAVLFEYQPIDFVPVGRKRRLAPTTFFLHVVSNVIQEVRKSETPAIRNKAHEHLLLIDKISEKLIGFNNPQYFGSIQSIGMQPYQAAIGTAIIHVLPFKTLMIDVAAEKQFEAPPTPPGLDLTENFD